MAERRYNEPTFGNPGRLKYYPHGVQQAEDWGWSTVRNHVEDAPNFREIGSHHQWFGPSQTSPAASSKGSWNETQRQKKWLLKNHPEAALGNHELGELLSDESALQQHHESVTRLQQFAIGQMTDTSGGKYKSVGVPLIAMATGSAGDALRIVRPSTASWEIGGLDSSGITATVSLLDHIDHQEILWTMDIGPIRHIRAVVSTKRFEPLRWLIIQRDFSTTVFQPEYQKAPVVSEFFSGTGPQAPSYIAPNPLFTISKSQTGFDSHCDVAFNVGIKSKPPQLAIIDGGGNWSIWDISGTRLRTHKNPRTRLTKCGNIREGVRQELPQDSLSEPQWHKILWVGHADPVEEDDLDEEEEEDTTNPTSSFPPVERSTTLLLCNQRAVRLLDLESDTFIPDLRFIPDGSKDVILDVSVDARDQRYFYVVTTSRLFVAAELTAREPSTLQVQRKTMILESWPHLRSKLVSDLKITVAPGPPSTHDRTSLVLLYSQNSKWHDVFRLRFSRRYPKRVWSYHDRVVSQAAPDMTMRQDLQTLCLSPTSFTVPPSPNTAGDGNTTSVGHAHFYQIFSFGTDLSLATCLGASSISRWDDESPTLARAAQPEPSSKQGKRGQHSNGRRKRLSSQEVQRRKAIRYLSSRFVVADSLAQLQFDSQAGDATTGSPLDPYGYARNALQRMIKPLHGGFHRRLQELWAESGDPSVHMEIYKPPPFDPVYVTVQEALENKKLPLKSILSMMQDLWIPRDIDETSQDWQAEIEQIRTVDPALIVTDLVHPRQRKHENTLHDVTSNLMALVLGSDPADDVGPAFTLLALRQVVCEVYLSQRGIKYVPLEPPLRATSTDVPLSPTSHPVDMLVDSQESNQSTVISSGVHFSSQASSRASTPASTTASTVGKSELDEPEDGSVSYVRALLGSGKPLKKTYPKSTWSTGTPFSTHIWSVDKITEVTAGTLRRQKHEAREAKKRKRAETLMQLQRDHNLASSTQPAPDTRFYTQASQPLNGPSSSSQPRIASSAPVVAMSQPVPGAFGGRADFQRPKKKPKRKGGF